MSQQTASWLDRLRSLVEDPPPGHVFEFSGAGIAWLAEGKRGFTPFAEGVLQPSPLKDNVLDTAAVAGALSRFGGGAGARRKPCVAILPDYCGRLTVLTFDEFPKKPEEQAALVRFRMKKTLPFDADSAAVSFHVQPGGRVVVAAVSLEILARYEQVLRAAGFHAGVVTLSTLAALEAIAPTPGFTVYSRLTDRALSIAVLEGGELRLARCVELTSPTEEEMAGVLQPTLAYAEDEFGATSPRLLRSDRPHDAGLEGYLLAHPRLAPGGVR
jgi:type IV pilus assembly protein PilM